jgi:mannose-1-phosphate guanylyltransferase / mannose-6-phosphate isomerase
VVIPLVLCGGLGRRLWPLSTEDLPKPFHALASDLSLFQNTLLRCVGEPFEGPVFIVCQERHANTVKMQAAAIDVPVFLILERAAYDSCAAAVAGAKVVHRFNPNAKLAIVAADQHVPCGDSWRKAVQKAALANYSGFVLFGVTPDRPSTAYGYVSVEKPCATTGLCAVKAFVEKPRLTNAVRYVAEGWLWNSGNFIVPADLFLKIAADTVPALSSDMDQAVRLGKRQGSVFHLHNIAVGDWPALSLDRAILEFSTDITVLPVDFSWSDVGTWDEVQRINGNQNTYVYGSDVPVQVIGLEDVIVVATPQGILVTRQGQSDRLKTAAK